ncbi:Creatininase/formamide hydrolase [Moorella glycerini]|uniref:Creatinine amidohydrolase n=1 Tax=Neomoorella stamsii TaxID=1266720 RepID=A0A9X7J0U9_9FIRM|nr:MULTISPECIES: creatininase family protein [Moorella]PRR70056.1 Creatinine amidohydrolase [Moorella stamsii]CEP66122.1 Creatininase/formamide hydrolase [Moorella glycerini]
MAENRAYILTEMTWPEVKEALDKVKVAVIPVGAHEQHGPHLVESCDAVRATEFCRLLAHRMYPKVIVAPTVNMGVSYHHMPFPGTISLKPATLISVLEDIVASLKVHGLKKFLFLNAHGGNQATLEVAATIIHEKLGIDIAWLQYTSLSREAMGQHIKSQLSGHSCEREVSEALYLAPHLVKKDRISPGDLKDLPYRYMSIGGGQIGVNYTFKQITANGALGDATRATYEAGKDIVEEALNRVCEFLEDFIGKR